MTELSATQLDALLRSMPHASTIALVGAGGSGMSALAHLLLDLGFRIVGSDVIQNTEIRELQSRGAQIARGHAEQTITSARPALVIFSSAIRDDNPELRAAKSLAIAMVRRGTVLASLASRQRSICVAGMHGKTTTSALLAHALGQLGAPSSYAVGALVPQLRPHGRFVSPAPGSVPFFVCEADESDGTLREFQPTHAIILNLDNDHLDYFGDMNGVRRAFAEFAERTRECVIYCGDDASLSDLLRGHPRAFSYGFRAEADYHLEIRPGTEGVAEFGLSFRGASLGQFKLALHGEMNRSNAAAVVALLLQLGFEADSIRRAIETFRGAERRQEELPGKSWCRVFDDYGHHPNEIRATLNAMRAMKPKRLLAAFQPHRYTRTQILLREFATCFREADRLWLADVYAASEEPIPGLTGETLAEAVRSQGQPADYVRSLDCLAQSILKEVRPGDLVLFLGAGDITRVAHEFSAQLQTLEDRFAPALAKELAARLRHGGTVSVHEPMSKHTTLRIGGPADLFVEPATEEELSAVLRFCAEWDLRFVLLGRGSNLLVLDGGIRGAVISMAHPNFSRLEQRGEELICGAGVKLKTVAVESKRCGLSGFEFLEGIPGTVGGALRMNAGAMGSSMFEVVRRVRLMNRQGTIEDRETRDVPFEYRNCPLFKDHIALGAVLRGKPDSTEAISARMLECSKKRWASQPAAPSAGCMFKNPQTIAAGRLIEELGLKGTRVGHASVSDVHGNFIVNEGGASAQDVLSLIDLVRKKARDARGIELETEVEIVGDA